MKYFVKLDKNNMVTGVVVVNDSEASTEVNGINFLKQLHNNYEYCKQTFRDRSQRKNFAGPSYTYNNSRDAFIPPKPHASWILNETTCRWQPPTEMPIDGTDYYWDEPTQSWDLVH
jgi:hypothetical protein